MRITKTILAVTALLAAGCAAATTTSQASVKTVVKSAAQTQAAPANQHSQVVNIFDSPSKAAHVIGKMNMDQRYIAIYRQGEWTKLGNPRNGQVGWINQKQYEQALQAWYQPDVQSIFVHTTKDKNGKPTVNVVAYSNGKKLDDKDAQAIYQRMRTEQQAQWRAMRSMNESFSRMQHQMDMAEDADFMWAPMMFPHMVLVRH